VVVAMGLPRDPPLHPRPHRRAPPSPLPRIRAPTRSPNSRPHRRPIQTRQLPQPTPLVRNSTSRIRLRHPHDPRAPRSLGCSHHDGIHPRLESRCLRHRKPRRRRADTLSALYGSESRCFAATLAEKVRVSARWWVSDSAGNRQYNRS
jgi:hypothetical protein